MASGSIDDDGDMISSVHIMLSVSRMVGGGCVGDGNSVETFYSPCQCHVIFSDQIRMAHSNIFLRADGLAGGLTPLSK